MSGSENPVFEARSRAFSLVGFSHSWESPHVQELLLRNNLHIVWHTRDSSPLLVPKVETIVPHYIRGRCIDTPGVYIHEIGGIETHIHLAASIAPTILISDFIGKLKGSSSHEANQKLGRKVLEWQTGYGVVSFGTGDLEWVKRYVSNQRERHARGQSEDRLERITDYEEMADADARQGP